MRRTTGLTAWTQDDGVGRSSATRAISFVSVIAMLVAGCASDPPSIEAAVAAVDSIDWAAQRSTSVVAVDDETRWGLKERLPVHAGSTAKLLTGAVALEVMGPGAEVQTRLLGSSPSEVTLVGAGDPLLIPSDLASLAMQLRDHLGTDGREPVRVAYVADSLRPTDRPPDWPAELVERITPASLLLRDGPDVIRGAEVAERLVVEMVGLGVPAVVAGEVSDAPASATEVARVSRTVDDLVRGMLTDSDSLVAEVLFGLIGKARGHGTSWRATGADAAEVLAATRVRTDGVAIADGSGTSRQNRLTTSTVTDVLLAANRRPQWSGISEGLPVAGMSGTLGPGTSRFSDPMTACARGNVRAKTGTLSGVSALSGYAESPDQGTLAFSIVLNGIQAGASLTTQRTELDRVAAVLTGCATR